MNETDSLIIYRFKKENEEYIIKALLLKYKTFYMSTALDLKKQKSIVS